MKEDGAGLRDPSGWQLVLLRGTFGVQAPPRAVLCGCAVLGERAQGDEQEER